MPDAKPKQPLDYLKELEGNGVVSCNDRDRTEALHQLVISGFIVWDGAPPEGGKPYWKVTEAGRAALAART